VASDLNDLLGVGAAIVGLAVGVSRYALVLLGRAKKAVEVGTASGFFIGLATAAAIVTFLVLT
jgi:hypothetical protein